jgi:hypothetical protein
MRVFDSLDDVREYFEQKATEASDRALAVITQDEPTGWLDKIKRASRVAEAYATHAAYVDALTALGEVRPGFTEALEEMGRKTHVSSIPGVLIDPYRCPECDTYSGEFTPTNDGTLAYMVHSICGRRARTPASPVVLTSTPPSTTIRRADMGITRNINVDLTANGWDGEFDTVRHAIAVARQT